MMIFTPNYEYWWNSETNLLKIGGRLDFQGYVSQRIKNFCSVPGSLFAQVVLQSKWILKNWKKLHGVSILVDYMHPFITSSRQKLRKSTKH